MTNADRFLAYVRQFPGRDDDQASADLNIRPRQQINQIANRLLAQNEIKRRIGPSGKLSNYPA